MFLYMAVVTGLRSGSRLYSSRRNIGGTPSRGSRMMPIHTPRGGVVHEVYIVSGCDGLGAQVFVLLPYLVRCIVGTKCTWYVVMWAQIVPGTL